MSKRYPGTYRRGDVWAWRAQFSSAGERSSLSGSGFSTAREAWEARGAALREAEDNVNEIPDLTLAEYLERWHQSHAQTVRPSSASGYRARVNCIKKTSASSRPLARLDEDAARTLVAELRAQAPAHKTLTIKLATLNIALSAAVRSGLLRRNPLDGMRIARTSVDPVHTPWTAAQARQFLTSRRQANDPLLVLWTLALTTGMRRGELLGLRWDDVDLEHSRLYVRRQRTYVRSEVVEGPPKTQGSSAPLALDARTLELLRTIPRTSEYVVNDPRTGRPYGNATTFRTDWQNAVKAAGLPQIRFHDLRHTCASILANAGVPLPLAQQRLRHWSPAMTQHYIHADSGLGAGVAEEIGDLLA